MSPGWIFLNRENVTTIKGVSDALSFVETDVELAITEMTDTPVRRCKHQEMATQIQDLGITPCPFRIPRDVCFVRAHVYVTTRDQMSVLNAFLSQGLN